MKNIELQPKQEDFLRNPKHKVAFRILSWFASIGTEGGTTDECDVALGLNHQSVSPRINELVAAECLSLTKRRKKTRSGRTAAVYAFQNSANFIAYLGMPPIPRKTKKTGLTSREQAILGAAKKYIDARPKAKSKDRVKKLVIELLHNLNSLGT